MTVNDSNHRTRWTTEEIEFLQSEWDGTHETCEVIAEILGRTPNAVAQRHYETEWGTAPEPVDLKPEVGGVVRRVTHTYTRTTVIEWHGEICPDCHTVRASNGSCWC